MSDEPSYFTDGAAYERLMGRWSRLAGEIFLDWMALPGGLRWLDVGCGTGAFTELLIARMAPAEAQGIDPSAAQIAYARERPGARAAHFRQGDAQALPFADDSFDAAAMALVISFIPNPAKAVAEMARVVRQGGWLGTYMWDATAGGSPPAPVMEALRSMGFELAMPPSVAVSTQEGLRGLWEGAGLGLVETREIHIPITFSNFDDFWQANSEPVGPAGQVIAKMSPAAIDQLKGNLRRQMPEGPIRYFAHANAVKGQVVK